MPIQGQSCHQAISPGISWGCGPPHLHHPHSAHSLVSLGTRTMLDALPAAAATLERAARSAASLRCERYCETETAVSNNTDTCVKVAAGR